MRWTAPYNLNDGLVRVSDDAVLPRRFELVTHNDEPVPNYRTLFELVDGAYQCRELTITAVDGGREVNSVDLRAVRIEDLLEIGTSMVAGTIETLNDGTVKITPAMTDAAEWAAVQQQQSARRAGKRRITDDLLREAADVYRSHQGTAPTAAVADRFGKSRRSASLYVKLAREAGFLDESALSKTGGRR